MNDYFWVFPSCLDDLIGEIDALQEGFNVWTESSACDTDHEDAASECEQHAFASLLQQVASCNRTDHVRGCVRVVQHWKKTKSVDDNVSDISTGCPMMVDYLL